jgi:hypothetical protein
MWLMEAHMPGNAERCRLNAAHCLKLAHHANTPEVQENVAIMAEAWRRLAAQIDCDAPLLRALTELELEASESSYALPSALKLRAWVPHGSLLEIPLVRPTDLAS